MAESPDIAQPAALIGDPARAAMLLALMRGQALTACELAHEAGVALSTTSSHLSRLRAGGLVAVRKSGRHKYFALAGEGAAGVIEALIGFAGAGPGERLRTGPKGLPGPRDPALREVLTPRYTLGCKRVLLSNDYYPALAQPNVTVLPTGLGAVRGDVVVGSDGTERRADVIILGTGFHVSDPPIAERIQRADGHTLAQVWSGSPEAHRGTAIAGFPNAFLVLGPNLAIGNNSAFVVIESQLRYITAALSWMRRTHTDVVEVRADRQAAYNAEVQRDLASTVWNTGGCQSYYLDANGRNSIGFPWSTDRMQALLAEFDHDNYDKRSPRAARGHVATTRA